MFVHSLLIRATPGREADVDAALERFASALAAGVPGMRHLSWGRNVNPSGIERGFTHGSVSTFDDEAGFRGYWDHPGHARLLEDLPPLCDDRFAVDYTTEDDA